MLTYIIVLIISIPILSGIGLYIREKIFGEEEEEEEGRRVRDNMNREDLFV